MVGSQDYILTSRVHLSQMKTKHLSHNEQAIELYQEFMLGSAQFKLCPDDRNVLLVLLDDVLDSYNRLKFQHEVEISYQEYAQT